MAKKDAYDVDLLSLDESLQGPMILNHLQTKGFCKIKADVSSDDLDEAFKESEKLDSASRFFYPSVLLHEALLGVQGSSRIAKMHRIDAPDSQYSADGEHLQKIDELLTDIAMILQPYFQELGFSCSGRTVGMLHENHPNGQMALVEAFQKESKMTETEASKWLVDLIRGKILCVVSMGPTAGSMTLQPFSDADESIEVPTAPGDVFLIRQDALIHRHSSKAKCTLMSCFYMTDQLLSSKSTYSRDLQKSLSPATQALIAWAEGRMAEVKAQEVLDKEDLAELPREWTRAMNASYSSGQRLAITGLSQRIASTWDVEEFANYLTAGLDTVVEVPVTRWDYSTCYDSTSPEPWKSFKTSCRHMSFADGAELFNPKFFSLSPSESAGMDPVQRWTLECGYEAALKSGFTKKFLMNSFGGVYCAAESYSEWNICPKPAMEGGAVAATGAAPSVVCGRVSFIFGIKGPCQAMSMEECGAHLVAYMACQAISERGRYVKPPWSLFGGGYFCLSVTAWFPVEASGHLTKIGRAKTFDNYADGSVRGDGLSYALVKRHVEVVDGQAVIKADAEKNFGVFAGGFSQHNGKTKFGTPSGAAMAECLYSAMRTALLEPSDIDCSECSGTGHFFCDAVEGISYKRTFRNDADTEEQPFLLGAVKSNVGNSIDGAGMASLIKLLYNLRNGFMTPNLHVLELNPNMEAVDCPVAPISEALSFRTRVTYGNLFGTCYAGLNVSMIFQGQLDDGQESQEEPAKEPIAFWPAGGGVLDAELKAKRGYYVCGTMTKWEPAAMKERNKEYNYTFTLGENRWEDFQIWIDGDSKKVLIPGKASSVAGPEDAGGDPTSLGSWRINANPNYVLDFTEEGEETVREVDTPDTGLIGTQYKIVVKLAGRFLQVSWEKVPLDDRSEAAIKEAPVKGSTAEYFVAGTWNNWRLTQMERDKKVPGLFQLKCFAIGRHAFQIVRNSDWSQVIYPSQEWASEEEYIYGPDENAGPNSWYFNAAPSDGGMVISFQRTTEAGLDVKKVSWKPIREAALQDQ